MMRCGTMLRTFGLLLLLCAGDAVAQRAIRVDGFGTWTTYDTAPQAACPGWSEGSTLLLGPGYIFSGRDNPIHLTDSYCQVPTPGTLTQASFFYPDETALAQMIGANPNDRVTAKRYSLLDRPRFDFDNPPNGFQWTFYYFPDGGTIVGLYGAGTLFVDSTTYITKDGVRIFDAARDGFTGQYFCIDGLTYLGTWNGTLPSSSPCVTIGFRLFRARFE